MRKVKPISNIACAMLLAVGLTASAPVFADQGSDGGTVEVKIPTTTIDTSEVGHTVTSVQNTVGSGRQSGRVTTLAATSGSGEQGAENEAEPVHDQLELHKRGAALLAQLMQKHQGKEKTAAQKQHACEAHKQGLTTKFNSIYTNDQRQQDKITSIFNKAVQYRQNNNITSADVNNLVETAQADQQTSAGALTDLKTVDVTPDCNSTSVASDVATFKAAAQTVRTDMHNYRLAVRDVLHALINAKAAPNATTDTTGGNQ